MILYHATAARFLKDEGTILTEGIKPSMPGCGKQARGIPPHGVVWLSKTESTAHWGEYACAHCCIRLSIPSHDKRLAKWATWLTKHAPEIIDMILADEARDLRRSNSIE
jgi:hypothetical protein